MSVFTIKRSLNRTTPLLAFASSEGCSSNRVHFGVPRSFKFKMCCLSGSKARQNRTGFELVGLRDYAHFELKVFYFLIPIVISD
jgi:hypothetical protein